METDPAAESVFRKKVENEIEKDDVTRDFTFLIGIDDHEEVGPEVVSIVDQILSDSNTEINNISRSTDDVQEPTENIKVDDELKPKAIVAELAALIEEVETYTTAESFLRNKVEKEIEKHDVTRGSTFLTEIDDHEEVDPEVVSIVDKILSESTT